MGTQFQSFAICSPNQKNKVLAKWINGSALETKWPQDEITILKCQKKPKNEERKT